MCSTGFCWGTGGDCKHCKKPFENEQTRNDLKTIIMVHTLSVSVASVFFLHTPLASMFNGYWNYHALLVRVTKTVTIEMEEGRAHILREG